MLFKRILYASCALPAVGLLLLAGPVDAAPLNDDILGKWRLTKVLDSSEISSIDDRQAAKLVGKILVVQPTKITLAGESCEHPDFERHQEDTVRYLREEAHAASGKLGLPEVVTVVDLACTEALVKRYDRIVVYWKGFFFDAVKDEKEGVSAPTRR